MKNIIYTRKEIKYLLANITFMSSLFDLGSLDNQRGIGLGKVSMASMVVVPGRAFLRRLLYLTIGVP